MQFSVIGGGGGGHLALVVLAAGSCTFAGGVVSVLSTYSRNIILIVDGDRVEVCTGFKTSKPIVGRRILQSVGTSIVSAMYLDVYYYCVVCSQV